MNTTTELMDTNYDDIRDIIYSIKNRNQPTSRIVTSRMATLKSSWTREMAFDLSSYHGIDLTSGLEEFLKEELKK